MNDEEFVSWVISFSSDRNRLCNIVINKFCTSAPPMNQCRLVCVLLDMLFTLAAAADLNAYSCSSTFSSPAWDASSHRATDRCLSGGQTPLFTCGIRQWVCFVSLSGASRYSWIAEADIPGSLGTSRRMILRLIGIRWQIGGSVRCMRSSSRSGGWSVPWKLWTHPCALKTFTGRTQMIKTRSSQMLETTFVDAK